MATKHFDPRARASEIAAWCYQDMPGDSKKALEQCTDKIERAINDCVREALWTLPEHIKDEELKMSFNLRSEAPESAFEPAIRAYAAAQVRKERARIIGGLADALIEPGSDHLATGLARAISIVTAKPRA